MARRLASIRRGIAYQDLVAADALIGMVLDDAAAPSWVRLEHRVGGTFDDVVVGLPTGVVWKQIKWAANPGAEPLTIDTLSAVDSRRGKPLIVGFADSYRTISGLGEPFRLEFVTNRSPDSEFRKLLAGSTSGLKLPLPMRTRARIDVAWRKPTGMSRDEFQRFLETLRFLVNSPNDEERESNIRRLLKVAGCGEGAFLKLMDAIHAWSIDDSKERIERNDVEKVLGGSVGALPPNDFQLPDVRVHRVEASRELVRRIVGCGDGYVAVLGSPGSGKSTLLNTLRSDGVVASDIDVIVYNCFTGTSDAFLRTRARAENFTRFLATELQQTYASRFGRWLDVSAGDVERLLSRAGECLEDHRRLVLVVDGLDHAHRNAEAGFQSLFDSLPIALPPRVTIVVSAQVAEQLPPHLQSLEEARLFRVPPLDRQKVRDVLAGHRLFDTLRLESYREWDLCDRVLQVTGGHALQVGYVARQLQQAARRGDDAFVVLSGLPQFDGDVDAYYRSLLRRPQAALARAVLSVMAASAFELSTGEVAALLPPATDPHAVEDVLAEYSFLFDRTRDLLHFSHDSLRVFAKTQFPPSPFDDDAQVAFLTRLDGDPRQAEHLLNLSARHGELPIGIANMDCDWIARQIACGASTDLIHEGLRDLALSAVDRDDWRAAARWWGLKGCLERAESEGDLYEATIVEAWLAMGRVDLVERYLFVGGQFLSRVYPGPGVTDLLRAFGQCELAAKLEDRIVSETAPPPEGVGPDFEFEEYLRILALRADVEEVVDLIRARLAARAKARDEKRLSDLGLETLEGFAAIAVWACWNAGRFECVEQWLGRRPRVLSDDVAADLWFRVRLRRGDLAEHRSEAEAMIGAVTDRALLLEILDAGELETAVARTLTEADVPDVAGRWDDLWRSQGAIRSLQAEATLCAKLGPDWLDVLSESIDEQPSRVARGFLRSLVAFARDAARVPAGWRKGLETLLEEVRALRRWDFSSSDIHSAQFFVAELGSILEPASRAARVAGESDDFSRILDDDVVPALRTARICYGSGILGICDLLSADPNARQVVSRLLSRLESQYRESWEFKSGGLLQLASRYSRIGDREAAQRVLVAGVRASFTYGFRKDTIVNEFIVALEAVGSHLGDRLAISSEFVTKVLVLLDSLTDGAMLGTTPTHFLAVVFGLDESLALRLGRILHRKRRFGLGEVLLVPAFEAHGLDPGVARDFFRRVTDGTWKEDEQSWRADLVASDDEFATDTGTLKREWSERIRLSRYGAPFHAFPALIRAFVARGDVSAAISVFDGFEFALRELVAPYPLDDVLGDG